MCEATITGLLEECAVEVLTTMCFAGLEDEAEPGGEAPPSAISASVTFRGSHFGRFAVCMPRSAAECLSARFYGFSEDEPLPEGHAEAVVCELANMICGSFLSKLEPDRSFALDSPSGMEAWPATEEHWDIHRGFQLTEGPVEVFLRMDELGK